MENAWKNSKWRVRMLLLILLDVIVMEVSAFLALWVRFEFDFEAIGRQFLGSIVDYAPINIVLTVLIFYVFRLYTSLWKYASVNELVNSVLAVFSSGVLNALVMWATNYPVPRSFPILYTLFLGVFTVGTRFLYRFIRFQVHQYRNKRKTSNVMIIGAGDAGATIIKEMRLSQHTKEKVCCVIDDDPSKKGKFIQGCPIVGGRETIEENARKYHIGKIYVAMPSVAKMEVKEVLELCHETGCEVLTLPGIYQLVNGEVNVSQFREVEIDDLLGREPIRVNLGEILRYVEGKVVLVTGGGGSIGSELCRQLAGHHPKLLIIFDVYENNVYDIQQELKKKYPELGMKVLIGSVRDSRRIHQVFETYKPDVVYHAAAHKHVPLMEDSPNESIKNNVIGTYKTAYAAMLSGCEKFVLISTDKAVNPTNIMGASKRLCEMIVQSFDSMVKAGRAEQIPALFMHAKDTDDYMSRLEYPQEVKTEFVAVRFGNVLGSNGSVIPLFKKQIAAGGPVTVTHPDIIRYFMTIPEAVSLVLQAGTYAKGGEIFVLDMGSPVKIDTLARNLIRLSGYKPDVDIKIEYTGLRPGEKLFEEKLMAEEGLKKTSNNLIHIGCPIPFDIEKFLGQLENLLKACYANSENIRDIVADMVSTYHPAGKHGSEDKGEAYEAQMREVEK